MNALKALIAAGALAGCAQEAPAPAQVAAAPAAAAIDIAALPLPNARNRDGIARDYAASRDKGVYTLAVAPNGAWGSQDRTRNRTADDRRRNALQKCEHLGGEPCGLGIDNGVVVQAYAPAPSGLVYGGAFDAARVPFVTAETRDRLRTEYANRPAPEAVAIHRNGAASWWYGQPSDAEAQRRALEGCSQNSESQDCFIYDVNGRVQFARDTPLRRGG
jgi:hypothetical protein